MTANQRDELIFDYLEGNLSPEEAEAFRIQCEESEVLDREVRRWKNAYVHEPLPSIDALEQKLLIRSEHGTATTTIIRICVTVAALLLLNTSTPVKDVYVPEVETEATPMVTTVTPPFANIPSVAECSPVTNGSQVTEVTLRGTVPADSAAAATIARTSIIKDLFPLTVPSNQTKLEKVVIIKPDSSSHRTLPAKESLSREKERLIRKHLRQQEERRNAREFQKGKVPYVVPLKSNNF